MVCRSEHDVTIRFISIQCLNTFKSKSSLKKIEVFKHDSGKVSVNSTVHYQSFSPTDARLDSLCQTELANVSSNSV